MPLQYPKQNWNFVPAYQTSGVPWVKSYTAIAQASSGNATEIIFPAVTRWVAISIQDNTTDSALRIGFTQLGVESSASQANYFLLWSDSASNASSSAQTIRFEVRTQRIYIGGHAGAIDNVSIMAGLTTVAISDSKLVTGSNGIDGVG